jgi:hypothetical protein
VENANQETDFGGVNTEDALHGDESNSSADRANIKIAFSNLQDTGLQIKGTSSKASQN